MATSARRVNASASSACWGKTAIPILMLTVIGWSSIVNGLPTASTIFSAISTARATSVAPQGTPANIELHREGRAIFSQADRLVASHREEPLLSPQVGP